MIRISEMPRRFCTANKLRKKMFCMEGGVPQGKAILTSTRSSHHPSTYHKMRGGLATTATMKMFKTSASLYAPSPLLPFSRMMMAGMASSFHTSAPSRKPPSIALDERYVESWEDNIKAADVASLYGPRSREWWTGPVPEYGKCPGMLEDGTITSLPLPRLTKETMTRQTLLDYFDNTWALTEVLFSGLQGPEAFYNPPYHNLRHPLIFYYGHPAVLYINKMRVAGLMDKPINAYYEQLFETGVDEMSWDDMAKNHMAWPSVDEVRQYRAEVYKAVKDVILYHPAFETLATKVEDSPFWSVDMSFEHERIHIETSSVLFRELPLMRLRKPEQWPSYHPTMYTKEKSKTLSRPVSGVDHPVPEFLPVEEGQVTLGKPEGYPSFGWDNEYGHKEVNVKSFRAGKYKVTNGQFYEFVASGGYFTRENWSQEGWNWRCFRNLRHPTFWVPTGPTGLQAYRLRTIFDEIDMSWSNPVEVNYHEAKAFATWLSRKDGRGDGPQEYRIMTEAEHHRLRDSPVSTETTPKDDAVLSLTGRQFAEQRKANLNLAYGMTSPVNAFAPTTKGFHDVFGSVWEWCEDTFSPLPGFKIHTHYEDFSMPCFDGKHHLIMGGSFASTGDEASKFARFHFRPHFFQHAGFRLVEPNLKDPTLITSCMDNQGPYVGENPYRSSESAAANKAQYEDQEWLQRYLHLHYPDVTDDQAFPPFLPKEALAFPQRCAELLISSAEKTGAPTRRALDLGCATGGSSFALARTYPEVHGLELSQAFVDAAQRLQTEGSMAYEIKAEGDVFLPLIAKVPTDIERSRVTFAVGDALALPSTLGDKPTTHALDAVLLANVLCRLPDPRAALVGIAGAERGVIAPGGLLMLTTPFSWKAEFTPKNSWLGGTKNADGTSRSSLDELKILMTSLGYDLIESKDMPLVIRQHYRLYELIGAHATVWSRRT